MDSNETPTGVGADTTSPDTAPWASLDQVSESVWQLTEEVLELLRSQATHAVRKRKKRNALWLDDLTETQGNTVIAIKQLCDANPEGITLKKLAEAIGVTPAAASVMVELLVGKKMLERTRSESDRRAVLIRLSPDTSRLFNTSDQSLRQSFVTLADMLGPQVLYDWQNILVTVSAALKQSVVAGKTSSAKPSQPAGPPSDPDEKSAAAEESSAAQT